MNWDAAIERNRDDLLRFIGWMLASLGVVAGQSPASSIPHKLRLAVFRMLRAVESATRRLIVIQARGLVARARVQQAIPSEGIVGKSGGLGRFALFDPRKKFGGSQNAACGVPVITVFGLSDDDNRPMPREYASRVPGIEKLLHRIEVVSGALSDLQKQALRLARHRANQVARESAVTLSPMRPGWPPGYSARRSDEILAVLLDLDTLARRVENEAYAG